MLDSPSELIRNTSVSNKRGHFNFGEGGAVPLWACTRRRGVGGACGLQLGKALGVLGDDDEVCLDQTRKPRVIERVSCIPHVFLNQLVRAQRVAPNLGEHGTITARANHFPTPEKSTCTAPPALRPSKPSASEFPQASGWEARPGRSTPAAGQGRRAAPAPECGSPERTPPRTPPTRPQCHEAAAAPAPPCDVRQRPFAPAPRHGRRRPKRRPG